MAHPITLLNSHLLLHWEASDPLPRIQALANERPLIKGALVERLLLYDSVVIPTVDFCIVPVLVRWLGQSLYQEMLEAGALRFLRYRGMLAYAGAGQGIAMIRTEKGEDENWDGWKEAQTGEATISVQYWLERCLEVHQSERQTLTDLTVNHTQEVDLAGFNEKVAHETYMDVLSDVELQLYFSLRSTNLTRLQGIENNQLKVFGPQRVYTYRSEHEIDTLLGIAAANFELHLGELCEAQDVGFDPMIEPFLQAKARRVLSASDMQAGFTRILEVNDLPDVPGAVAAGDAEIGELWDARNGSACREFRQWFHEHVREEPGRASAEYVRALSEAHWIDSAPAKALRLVVVTAAGLASLEAGLAAGLVDSFVLQNIAGQHSPKWLIDELRPLLLVA